MFAAGVRQGGRVLACSKVTSRWGSCRRLLTRRHRCCSRSIPAAVQRSAISPEGERSTPVWLARSAPRSARNRTVPTRHERFGRPAHPIDASQPDTPGSAGRTSVLCCRPFPTRACAPDRAPASGRAGPARLTRDLLAVGGVAGIGHDGFVSCGWSRSSPRRRHPWAPAGAFAFQMLLLPGRLRRTSRSHHDPSRVRFATTW